MISFESCFSFTARTIFGFFYMQPGVYLSGQSCERAKERREPRKRAKKKKRREEIVEDQLSSSSHAPIKFSSFLRPRAAYSNFSERDDVLLRSPTVEFQYPQQLNRNLILSM